MTDDGGRRVLPRLLLIADGFATVADVRERALAAVEAGVPWVQLRDHEASSERFADEAERFVTVLRERLPGVAISVNTHTDVARRLGVGLHVGTRGPSAEAVRRLLSEAVVSVAAHSIEEARAAEGEADAVLFSPIFPTTSKIGHPGMGLDALATCCAALPGTPVLALGGITPERVANCLGAGAYGVAVLSGILHAADPVAATSRFLAELQP